MRRRFDEQLRELNTRLIEMGRVVEAAIRRATDAFLSSDAELARTVVAGDDEVNEIEREIERQCLRLLLNQQPVARDLRQISTALKMITDLERIGDQAADIAELAIFLARNDFLKRPEKIREMAEAAIKMVTESIEAFVRRDAALAEAVIAYDDVVDDLFSVIRRDMIRLVREDAANGEHAFDLMQIAKYYERIGDHAVNIAEWVIFSVTGVHKERASL
ncbi:MAG: phosphate signaling complex protein PhoU [Oscillospiraceae bacterium]|jgi:phosphate transport system protein|nr:phosphate signaling complex protein PhoU [Oscillospiraceae bacterium]